MITTRTRTKFVAIEDLFPGHIHTHKYLLQYMHIHKNWCAKLSILFTDTDTDSFINEVVNINNSVKPRKTSVFGGLLESR